MNDAGTRRDFLYVASGAMGGVEVALAGGAKAGLQLRPGLPRKPVSHPEGIFPKR